MLKLIERITPKEIGQDWPDLARLAGGTVWARPGLSQKTRSQITIAMLTALYRPEELRTHIWRGLHNGLSREEVCEIIMHAAVYGGFPVGMEGMRIAKLVFEREDRDAEQHKGADPS